MKYYSTYIIHKTGPIGSTNTSYRITSLGFQKGIILFKDLTEIKYYFSAEKDGMTNVPDECYLENPLSQNKKTLITITIK